MDDTVGDKKIDIIFETVEELRKEHSGLISGKFNERFPASAFTELRAL
jgi:hypothetical protein